MNYLNKLVLAKIFGLSLILAPHLSFSYDYENVRLDKVVEPLFEANPIFFEGTIRIAKVQGALCLISTNYAEANGTGFSDFKEAEKIAILDGRKEMIAFLGGQKISAMDFVSLESETVNEATRIREVFASKTQSQIEGMIHGVRQVGSWRVKGEPVVFTAQLLKLEGLMAGGVDQSSEAMQQRDVQAPSFETSPLKNSTSGEAGGVEDRSMDIVVISSAVASFMGNKEISRTRAINQACEEAIRQGLGQIIDSSQMVSKGELVEKIISQSEGFIREYKVLEEGVEGDAFRVTIEAFVTRERLASSAMQIGLLKSMVGNPRVSIIAKEVVLNKGVAVGVKKEDSKQLLLMLEGAFADFGITPTDMKQQFLNLQTRDPDKFSEIQNIMDRMSVDGEVDYDIQQFGRLGVDAELIVTGTVVLNNVGFDSDGIRSIYEAATTLKILYASTGEILGSVVETVRAAGVSPDLALQNACDKMRPRTVSLITDTLQRWTDMANNGINILVYVKGIPDRRIARSFRNDISQIMGVASAEITSRDSDDLNFSIKYKGTSTDFANYMEDWIDDNFLDRLDEIGADVEVRTQGNRVEVIFD